MCGGGGGLQLVKSCKKKVRGYEQNREGGIGSNRG